MKARTLGNAFLAASLLMGGATTALRATAAPALVSAAAVAQTDGPFFPPELQLLDLKPEIRTPIQHDTSSVSLKDLDAAGLYKPDAARSPSAFEQIRRQVKRANYTPQQLEDLKQKEPAVYDSLGDAADIQSLASPLILPSPIITFYGQSSDDQVTVGDPRYTPPDTNGDVGPNHYVQAVNTTWGVYDKATGARILGPLKGSSFYAGFGGPCETTNDGDPIVLYDQLADRWLISQFALPNIGSNAGPFYQCIAISTTGDPTGTYHRYQYLFDNNDLNDYPHFGLWPDAYYATVNVFTAPGFSFTGMAAMAYERDKMLIGAAAQQIIFKTTGQPSPINKIGGGLPSDLDGRTLPPAGAPNIIAAPEAAEWTFYPTDRIHFFKFHVDWTTPANSTFTGPVDINTGAWNSVCDSTRACVPQSGSSANLDAISDRFMWRLAYRNFGTHQTLVANQTVNDGANRAAVRWYEIRDPHAITPTIYQQSTYAPADGVWRWMGSAAQDAQGNMIVGFSGSSASQFPDIRYAGRMQGDPLNTLGQGETIMMAGGGSQTSTGNRWGDYSNLTLDPIDDCTFWYTQEIYRATSSNVWSTGIGAFKFAACGVALSSLITGTVTDITSSLPISGALVVATNGTTFTLSSLSNGIGVFGIGVPGGVYTVSASAYGYYPLVVPGVIVTDGVTVTLSLALTPAPSFIISGTVTEEGTGNPLTATVTANGSPYPVVVVANTDPATGYYSMTLVGGGQSWTVGASAAAHGPQSQNLGAITANQTVSFVLPIFTNYTCGGVFTAGDPTYNRTLTGNPPTALSGSATTVFYRPIQFSVSSTGQYSMVMASGFDGFYTLYQTSFNPLSPLANAIEAVDDAVGLNPAIFRTLSAGTQYILVASTFSNGTAGAFTDAISGFGEINATCGFGPTPTPTSSPTATPTPTGTPPTPTPTPTATSTPMPGDCLTTQVVTYTMVPDNNPAGICVSIPYLGTGNITTMSLRTALSHTWIGDFRLWLVNPASQSLVLMNRPGGTGTSVGSSANLAETYPITFTDAGALSAESMGTGVSTSQNVCQLNGVCSFVPNQDSAVSTFTNFSGFVGQSAYGTWQFCANDNASSDLGAIFTVTLDIACVAPPTATPTATATVTGTPPTPTDTPTPTATATATDTPTATPTNTPSPTPTSTPLPLCVRYNVMLDGSQETPSNTSLGMGMGYVEVDTVANSMYYNVSFSGMTGTETAAHIHGFSARGVNSSVIWGLATGSPKTGSVAFTEPQEANLLLGLAYFNIHTNAFPGGEIRGQIDGPGSACLGTPTPTATPTGTPTATPTSTPLPARAWFPIALR